MLEDYRGKFTRVGADKGRLRIGICRSVSMETFGVKQKYFYPNFDDTAANRIRAQEIAMKLESDIEAGRLNLDLNWYLNANRVVIEIPEVSSVVIPSVLELFDQFVEFKEPQLNYTTNENTYKSTYRSILSKCPQDLTKQAEIVDHLYHNWGSYNFVRLCNVLDTACEWAKKRDLLPSDFKNRFLEFRQDYKVNHARRGPNMLILDAQPQYCRDKDCRAFPVVDVQCIKEACYEYALATHTPIKGRPIDPDDAFVRLSVADYVNVGFATGARPCEISAFRWNDISDDFSILAIRNAYNTKKRVLKCLKNEFVGQEGTKARNFPIFPKLAAVFEERKRKFYNGDPNSFVFQYHLDDPYIPLNTNHLHYHWYGCKNNNKNKSKGTSTTTYRGVVIQLFLDKKISIYLSPKAMRHTWITHQLQSGVSVHDVAKLVGNTPKIIWDNYSSVIEGFSPIVEF
jgi:integrase